MNDTRSDRPDHGGQACCNAGDLTKSASKNDQQSKPDAQTGCCGGAALNKPQATDVPVPAAPPRRNKGCCCQ